MKRHLTREWLSGRMGLVLDFVLCWSGSIPHLQTHPHTQKHTHTHKPRQTSFRNPFISSQQRMNDLHSSSTSAQFWPCSGTDPAHCRQLGTTPVPYHAPTLALCLHRECK